MSSLKRYRIRVKETRTYSHEVEVVIPECRDPKEACDDIKDYLNEQKIRDENGIYSAYGTNYWIDVTDVDYDMEPVCTYDIIGHKEVSLL